MKRNDVSSFFYYMWNAWCEKECEIVFAESGTHYSHFWDKWCYNCDRYGASSAAENFYAELSEKNRDRLVSRAIQMYNRDTKIVES